MRSPDRSKLRFPIVGGNDLGGGRISTPKHVQMSQDTEGFRPTIGLHRRDGRSAAYIRDHGIGFVLLPAAGLFKSSTRRSNGRLTADLSHARTSLPALRRCISIDDVSIGHTTECRIHGSRALPTSPPNAPHAWSHRGDPTSKGVDILAQVLADWIISVSRYVKSGCSARAIGQKWTAVQSPIAPDHQVDREAARAALLAESGVTVEARFLACAGELIERKRPKWFADVVAGCIEAAPEVPVMGLLFDVVSDEFPVVGRAALRRALERGIADRTKLLHFKSPLEPDAVAVGLLVVPSLDELFGRTLIESMSLGIVVVATDHGGNPEAILEGKIGIFCGHQRHYGIRPTHTPDDLRSRAPRTALQRRACQSLRHRQIQITFSRYYQRISLPEPAHRPEASLANAVQ